ncbi:uncharacterized protein LOC128491433 [Spea bombifrons]|uniref:uncharacterized protein LOC128491433 n=1 Tax=Spea bombifrons TaxID=233779 RepID=UPI0023499F7B|nr:uncharacterized protein LOC128491433 [Spea bombifrons]
MSMSSFDYLLHLLRPSLTLQETHMRKPIQPVVRLLITLRFMATGESFSSLQFQFYVGKTTIANIVKETCTLIWEQLGPSVMPAPTVETWLQVAAGFGQVANFPNCLGAVDGKHIRVKKPPHSGSLYFNYKRYFSIILMAVADINFKFVAVDVGGYGSSSDSRVLQASKLGHQLLLNQISLPPPRPLPGTSDAAPFVMVSDEAFPLSTNLLRPFPKQGLDSRKRIFNYRLSSARKVVECAFGIMANKWRVLHTVIHLNVETVDQVVKACCALHNNVRDRDGLEVDFEQHPFLPRSAGIHLGPI